MTWQGTKGGSSTDVDATRPTDIQREHLLKHKYGKYYTLKKKNKKGQLGKGWLAWKLWRRWSIENAKGVAQQRCSRSAACLAPSMLPAQEQTCLSKSSRDHVHGIGFVESFIY